MRSLGCFRVSALWESSNHNKKRLKRHNGAASTPCVGAQGYLIACLFHASIVADLNYSLRFSTCTAPSSYCLKIRNPQTEASTITAVIHHGVPWIWPDCDVGQHLDVWATATTANEPAKHWCLWTNARKQPANEHAWIQHGRPGSTRPTGSTAPEPFSITGTARQLPMATRKGDTT